jgi:type VI secretion system protein ImpK
MSILDTSFAGLTGPGSARSPRRENLALLYQEVLTVIIRLRSNRQTVTDTTALRRSMKSALNSAETEALRKGYSDTDARLASFAVVSFLDEFVENAKIQGAGNWSHQSFQVEIFGEPTADETFFQCIDKVIARGDSALEADVLEVFALCLLLGYEGIYRNGRRQMLPPIITKITEKIRSIRGAPMLAIGWEPPTETALRPPRDPWVLSLVACTVGALVLGVLILVGFKFALLSGAAQLHSLGSLAPR